MNFRIILLFLISPNCLSMSRVQRTQSSTLANSLLPKKSSRSTNQKKVARSARFRKNNNQKKHRLLHTTTPQLLQLMQDCQIICFDYNHDANSMLTATQNGVVKLWDSTGNLLKIITTEDSDFVDAHFNKIGNCVLLIYKDRILLYSINTDQQISIKAEITPTSLIKFDYTKTIVMVINPHNVSCFCAYSAKPLYQITDTDPFAIVSDIHDGNFVITVSQTNVLKLWQLTPLFNNTVKDLCTRLETKEYQRALGVATSQLSSTDYSKSQPAVRTEYKTQLPISHISTLCSRATKRIKITKQPTVQKITAFPENTKVILDAYNTFTNASLLYLKQLPQEPEDVLFTPNGQMFVVIYKDTAEIYDRETCEVLSEYGQAPIAYACTPRGFYVAVQKSTTESQLVTEVIEIQQNKNLLILPGCAKIKFSSQGRFAVRIEPCVLQIFDLETMNLYEVENRQNKFCDASFIDSNMTLLINNHEIFDLQTFKFLPSY